MTKVKKVKPVLFVRSIELEIKKAQKVVSKNYKQVKANLDDTVKKIRKLDEDDLETLKKLDREFDIYHKEIHQLSEIDDYLLSQLFFIKKLKREIGE